MAVFQDIQRLNRLIKTGQQKLIAAQAKNMLPFLEKMSKREDIHAKKRYHLEIAVRCLKEIEKNNNVPTQYAQLADSLSHYTLLPSVYLFRHPDKTKEPGRALSNKGVLQAKLAGEHLRDDVLLSIKPVLLRIWTSELNRTEIFGRIIQHVNDAQRTGAAVTIDGPREHVQLFMGPANAPVMELIGKVMEKGTEFDAFLQWVEHKDAFMQHVRAGNVADPDIVERNITAFVKDVLEHAEQDISNNTITIGLSHSWTLDTFLYKRTGIRELIGTAEFAKVECNELYYKKHWHRL
ncbi:MAG: hypothetical protein V1725_07900 [archaeon]